MKTLAPKMLMVEDGSMVALRLATPDDAEALLGCVRMVLEDGTGMCLGADELCMTIEEERAWIRKHVEDPKSFLIVAEVHGDIVGMLDFHPLPRRMLSHVGEMGMSIHPDWRSKGLGRLLLESLLEWAPHAEGLDKLTLSVRSDNAPAIALYGTYGFVEEGRRVGQILLEDGTRIDEVLMARDARPA